MQVQAARLDKAQAASKAASQSEGRSLNFIDRGRAGHHFSKGPHLRQQSSGKPRVCFWHPRLPHVPLLPQQLMCLSTSELMSCSTSKLSSVNTWWALQMLDDSGGTLCYSTTCLKLCPYTQLLVNSTSQTLQALASWRASVITMLEQEPQHWLQHRRNSRILQRKQNSHLSWCCSC